MHLSPIHASVSIPSRQSHGTVTLFCEASLLPLLSQSEQLDDHIYTTRKQARGFYTFLSSEPCRCLLTFFVHLFTKIKFSERSHTRRNYVKTLKCYRINVVFESMISCDTLSCAVVCQGLTLIQTTHARNAANGVTCPLYSLDEH